MRSFGEISLVDDVSLLVGVQDQQVVFSRPVRNARERAGVLEEERRHCPELVEDPAALETVADLLGDYISGLPVDPAAFPVRFSQGTAFQIHIWETLRMVSRGKVTGYGDLSKAAGYNGAARAVGQAMARNHLLLFVPCHRVVTATGALGGFSAGVELKKTLLALEGVEL